MHGRKLFARAISFHKGEDMNCFDVLDLVEKTSSKNEKVRILKENLNTPSLADILLATFDYHRTYLIKEFPEPTGVPKHPEMCFGEILIGCERYGRIQECKQDVSNWLASRPEQETKWYRRVILRDLRCGFSADTAIAAGFSIPTFEVQLATDSNKCKKIEQIVKQGVLVSPKLDGYRCLAIGTGGEFTLYSRNGSVYQNFPSIKKELETLFPVGDYVFDGEIMSSDFNAMQQTAFASKRGTAVGDVKYFIFDTIRYSEWTAGVFLQLYNDRYSNLVSLISKNAPESDLLNLVVHDTCNTVEDIRIKQAEFESMGFEGAMANPNIPYYMGRKSNALLKFKSMMTQDCVVVDFVEGNGRLEGTLGKVIVTQENGNTGEVGSGFSDAERKYIWENKDLVTGRVIEVKFQELTKDGYFRFPIFMRYRDKGDGKKI